MWIFPKGHIEPGEAAPDAALRETREEAGIAGEILAEVGGPIEFMSGREPVRVRYFLIQPTDESPATDGREKRWFTVGQAHDALSFENARALLREAIRMAAEHA